MPWPTCSLCTCRWRSGIVGTIRRPMPRRNPMIIEEPSSPDQPAARPLLAEQPVPPGSDIAELVDDMEERVLHGEAEEAQEEKEVTEASEQAPEPKDADPSGGKSVYADP